MRSVRVAEANLQVIESERNQTLQQVASLGTLLEKKGEELREAARLESASHQRIAQLESSRAMLQARVETLQEEIDAGHAKLADD